VTFGFAKVLYVHDQRIEAGPALGGKDGRHGPAVGGVRTQAIDSFRGKGHQPAFAQNARRAGNVFPICYGDFVDKAFHAAF
jgi:hypothetical protein